MNQELQQEPAAQLPQSVAEMKAQINAIQDLMRQVMAEGVHYGVIRGTNNKTLYKAGAEILLTAFRIAVIPEIIDMSTHDEIRVRILCKGVAMSSNVVVGVGIGEASTNEEKYKWKKAFNDQEFNETPEDRRRIKQGTYWEGNRKLQGAIKQVRTNPADLANTILKMAKKRAQVDMTVTALAASDVFEHKAEDVTTHSNNRTSHQRPAEPEPFVPNSPPPQRDAGDPGPVPMGEVMERAAETMQAPEDAPAQEAPGGRGNPFPGQASEAQIKMIQAKCRAMGASEADLLKHFKMVNWNPLRKEQVDLALRWIEENKQ